MSGKSKTIDASQLSAYERYELPTVGGSAGGLQKVKLPTAEELEEIQKQAKQAGYEAGFKKGHQDGLAKGKASGEAEGKKAGLAQGLQEGLLQGKAQVDNAVSQLSSVMAELVEPLRQSEEHLEQALLNTALAISRAVIIRELQTSPEHIANVIHLALGHLAKVHHENIALKVNAGDLEYVKSALGSIETPISVEVGADILPGGCIVESDKQVIDFTLEKRFQKTVQSLLVSTVAGSDVIPASEGPDTLEDMADLHRDILEEEGDQQTAEASEDSESASEPTSKRVAEKHSEKHTAEPASSAKEPGKKPVDSSSSDDEDFDDESPF